MAPVVADASVLAALSKLNRLELLRDLFQQVSIPPTVSREIFRTLPQLPDWIQVVAPQSADASRDVVGLHQGEIEAIALGLEVQASLLILDDLPAGGMRSVWNSRSSARPVSWCWRSARV